MTPLRSPEEIEAIIDATREWVIRAVIGLNLCPFAKSVHVKKQIRYVVSPAQTHDELLDEVRKELELLESTDPKDLDTTLLIHPDALVDFLDFNSFLPKADRLIRKRDWEGVFQIANLHPDYCFAEALPEDVSNLTNRSPYPTLHLLRESSIDRAVAAFPDAESIYLRNIEMMQKLGHEGWKKLFAD